VNFSGIFSGVTSSAGTNIINLLDIFIVAYLIYTILKLISDTRAAQILRGLMILVGVSFLSSYFDFQMLSWILDKAWLMFTVALPVVFQQELRHLLEQLGEGKWFNFRTEDVSQRQVLEDMILEIEEMAARLSKAKTGALVVFERKIKVDEYLDSGRDLDAIVSAPLLINIFEPNTPLHDGAVLVRKGRIARAACFMPLSVSNQIDPQLGTRHRAGIGITEVSDAVVVIVSEETGTISVARAGRLTRYLDPQVLASILRNELLPSKGSEAEKKESWKSNIKRYFHGADKNKKPEA